MQAQRKAIQGTAWYNGEQVDILDVIQIAGMREAEYLINYNGPTWVKASFLNNIIWSVN
jgi:hypothetical protein